MVEKKIIENSYRPLYIVKEQNKEPFFESGALKAQPMRFG